MRIYKTNITKEADIKDGTTNTERCARAEVNKGRTPSKVKKVTISKDKREGGGETRLWWITGDSFKELDATVDAIVKFP